MKRIGENTDIALDLFNIFDGEGEETRYLNSNEQSEKWRKTQMG